MNKLLYYLLYAAALLMSLLPFRVLYLLSDSLYLLVYHVIRYRRGVVRRNLSTAFPQWDERKLKETERAFYHWFCDYIFETIKLLTISDETLLRHIEFHHVEALEHYFDQGQDCAAILGHYCNWEWLSATGLAFRKHADAVMGLIYHPLRNEAFDRLFIALRSSHKGVCVAKQDTLRYLVGYRRDNRRSLFGYIADQAPKWENIHLWLPFLNHDTPVFTGAERIMRKMNDAVFYVDMQRPRRGKYICTFRLITDQPATLSEHTITTQFFRLLEESISNQPAYYLWTHNRWGRTHEEFDRRFQTVNNKNIKIKEEQ